EADLIDVVHAEVGAEVGAALVVGQLDDGAGILPRLDAAQLGAGHGAAVVRPDVADPLLGLEELRLHLGFVVPLRLPVANRLGAGAVARGVDAARGAVIAHAARQTSVCGG